MFPRPWMSEMLYIAVDFTH